jgi:hypothetical protein
MKRLVVERRQNLHIYILPELYGEKISTPKRIFSVQDESIKDSD